MSHKFLFIITYGRSGSTLLQNYLNMHENVLVRGENENVFYETSRLCSAVESIPVGRWGAEPSDPWYGASSVQSGPFEMTARNNLVRNVLAPDDETEILGFKEIRHTPYFMDEEAFYNYCLWLLSWPFARIIFNYRNVEEAAKSAWHANEPDAAVSLRATRDRMEDASHKLRLTRRVYDFHFEEFVKDFGYAKHLNEWMDLPWREDYAREALGNKLTHAGSMAKA